MSTDSGPVARRLMLKALAMLLPLKAVAATTAAPGCVRPAGAARPLTAVTMALAPWGVSPPGAPPRGIFVDLMASVAGAGKLCIDNQVVPYSRGLAMIASGQADLVISFRNTLLQSIAVPIGMGVGDAVVVIAAPGVAMTTLADLRGKLVAHVRDVEYDDFSSDARIRKAAANGVDLCLRMLAAGRVDAVIGSGTALAYALRQLQLPPGAVGRRWRWDTRSSCCTIRNKATTRRWHSCCGHHLPTCNSPAPWPSCLAAT
jgi:polar amino acid transport system substrate-binding protein